MIPELFNVPGALLYIGAHVGGFSAGKPLWEAGNQITVLDIWPNAIEQLKGSRFSKFIEQYVLGDVRQLSETGLSRFDYSVWLHGPEHIAFGELPGTLSGLENITDSIVILACPWGRAPHGWRENPHNKHLSFLEPNDFYRLGYQVAALSPINRLGGHILAWKRLNEETGDFD
jgi:hypothetical protein